MAQSKLIQAPAGGLNSYLPANMINDRETPDCENVLFSGGVIKTPYGFAKLSSTGLPLDSGKVITGMAHYKEQDGSEHIVASTTDKIYERDTVNDTWVDISPTASLISNLQRPVSFAIVPHTDAIAVDGAGANAYYHLLLCDGGLSPVYRWAGKQETKFYELAGADGYHGTEVPPVTAHYAQQVNIFNNHVILVNPKVWDETAEVFKESPQTILWGKVGLLEGSDVFDITATGAGYNDLVDTGDHNVWARQLGNQLIIYQTQSIWSMSHVGGSDVFRFRTEIPDVGLLAPHLLTSIGNRHYFVGHDYNVYEYMGSSYKKEIGGDKIQNAFKDLVTKTFASRCRMSIDTNGSTLWIYVVPDGGEFAVNAYGYDLKTGAWTFRDFTNVWSSSNGITAMAVVGAQSYMIGDSYQEAVDSAGTYEGDAITLDETVADTTWSAVSGEYTTMTGTGSAWKTAGVKLVEDGDTVHITAGTNVKVGVYVVASVTSDTEIVLTEGVQDGGGAVSAVTYKIYGPPSSGKTYRDLLQEVLTEERLTLADSDGYIYQCDPDLTAEDGEDIDAYFMSKIFDYGLPDVYKWWEGLTIVAKGGEVVVSYRIGSFDDPDTGWSDFTSTTLTDGYESYEFYFDGESSKQIQFKFSSNDGSAFQIRSFKVHKPNVEDYL